MRRSLRALRLVGMTSFLHIGLDGGNQDIAGHHTVLGGEAIGKIIGVDHLGIGRELVIALPNEDLHMETGHQLELVAVKPRKYPARILFKPMRMLDIMSSTASTKRKRTANGFATLRSAFQKMTIVTIFTSQPASPRSRLRSLPRSRNTILSFGFMAQYAGKADGSNLRDMGKYIIATIMTNWQNHFTSLLTNKSYKNHSRSTVHLVLRLLIVLAGDS